MNTIMLRRVGQKALPVLQRQALPALAARTTTIATQNHYYFSYDRRRCFSSPPEKEEVPPEDYYNGHLMADHLEYLDDMMEKTIKVETVMDELKETYAQKKEALKSSSSSQEEIDALFAKAAAQKGEISSQIADLKAALHNAKGMAVDSPDGVSDDELQQGFAQVNEIIDRQAKSHENAAKINKQHKLEDAIRKDRARDPEHDW